MNGQGKLDPLLYLQYAGGALRGAPPQKLSRAGSLRQISTARRAVEAGGGKLTLLFDNSGALSPNSGALAILFT